MRTVNRLLGVLLPRELTEAIIIASVLLTLMSSSLSQLVSCKDHTELSDLLFRSSQTRTDKRKWRGPTALWAESRKGLY